MAGLTNHECLPSEFYTAEAEELITKDEDFQT